VICAALWFDPADEDCPPEFREAVRREMRQWARESRGLMSAESYNHFEAVQKKPALLDDDEMLRTLLLDFIADFANWDNSTRREYLETSRALTEAAHLAAGGEPGTRPLVVDPFAGGGAIPLEALRVGADAFASDLNPVAVLLNKVVLEYIPRYGQRLADEVRKWGAWVKAEAEKELAEFYPQDPDGATPIAYLWARTITCEGPGCGAEVPLMRSLWLAKKGSRSTALRLIPNRKEKRVDFEIVQNATGANEGTVRRGSATCPVCGFTTPVASVRRQMKLRRGGADDARLFCVVTTKPSAQGRFYRLPTKRDITACANAKRLLNERKRTHNEALSLVPDEPTPQGGGSGAGRAFSQRNYGMDVFADLFTSRQALALTTLARLVRKVGNRLTEKHEQGFADAVQTCLAISVNRHADQQSSLVTWLSTLEAVSHTFVRQALPISWDFVEPNPLSQSGGNFAGAVNWVCDVVGTESKSAYVAGHVEECSATHHPLSDDSAHAFITDPPYYDAVPYADLSDFFFVWMKRTLPASAIAFSEPLTPKADECIVDEVKGKDRAYFERTMGQAMAEGRRVLHPSGIGIVVFAHKSTAGWEAQLQAMVDAGWTMTGSWAIDTERSVRLRAQGSAALASSIHLVCRPRENADGSVRANDIGDWRDVLRELPVRIHEWMPRLAKEGVVGADAIFACLGPALEVFSRYSRVEKASGEQVTLREYLEYVWAAVAKEALTLIFAGETDADVTGFEEDARLTAMWLWTLFAGAKPEDDKQGTDEDAEAETDDEESSGKSAKPGGFTLEYDAARKIAQGLGAHLEELTQLVEVKGDKARLLPVAERTKHLFGKDEAEAPRRGGRKKDKQAKLFDTLDDVEAEAGGWGEKNAPQLGDTVLDRVHQAMILFAAGRGDAMKRFLVDDGVGNDERFWRLANALSALYPSGGDEKRWVDGVLARKKGLGF
jgi:adenine-specific DNA methylase